MCVTFNPAKTKCCGSQRGTAKIGGVSMAPEGSFGCGSHSVASGEALQEVLRAWAEAPSKGVARMQDEHLLLDRK